MPNLVAYDICGVQPMSGPTGLIFAMKSHYEGRGGAEALYNEAPTATSLQVSMLLQTHTTQQIQLLATTLVSSTTAVLTIVALSPMAREDAEHSEKAESLFREMSFSIEKTSVTAQSRAFKAEYTLELAQDLKAIHGLDAEQELANILSSEILAEINREVVRTVYTIAKLVLRTTLLTLVASTSMLTPTVVGRLKIQGTHVPDRARR